MGGGSQVAHQGSGIPALRHRLGCMHARPVCLWLWELQGSRGRRPAAASRAGTTAGARTEDEVEVVGVGREGLEGAVGAHRSGHDRAEGAANVDLRAGDGLGAQDAAPEEHLQRAGCKPSMLFCRVLWGLRCMRTHAAAGCEDIWQASKFALPYIHPLSVSMMRL